MFHECDPECSEYKDRDHPIKERWQINEHKFNRCPLSYVEASDYFWLVAYKMFKNGFLPNVGGWLNQGNKFIEAMIFIDEEVTKAKNEVKNVRK